ncbi:MAG: hypothetical protein K0U23_02805 [Gammaproteobacteria bacterium]|nr:hypothetical protein [Gammaproteobacteria bacterium]
MNAFIASLAILFILALIGAILLRKKNRIDVIHYACKQYCEHYQFKYVDNSVERCPQPEYHYQFSYHDKTHQRTGYIILQRSEVKEIIFDKRSLDPRQNSPLFKSANDINNVVEFPKKR